MIEPSPDSPPGEERLVGSDRVLVVLRVLAERPEGVGLEEMAKALDSPKPTVHRALAALRRAGFAIQDGRGRYLLGDEFLRLAFTHHEARPDHARIRPALERLANRFGETAHYAVLDRREVVYRAKVDSPSGAVRLSSTVGGRNPAHNTGVGKVLLAWALPDDDAVRAWAAEGPLSRPTRRTKVAVEELCAELATVRELGYAVDDQENEEGVNCLAVPAFLTSSVVPSGAVSVSALAYRTPLADLVAAVAEIRDIVAETR
ncbi:IclR family transcriptional regulator [Nonomuraea sp. NPDC046570]|uniref:IclR family transcriptional regulator n=1 Tax=Nonomuraea sp. NPDC046570 TaxID=3155255 RepID=UPI0033FFC89C